MQSRTWQRLRSPWSFTVVHSGSAQGMFQASTVCRSWRRAGRRVFFGRPWKSPTLICHPLQLFSTVRLRVRHPSFPLPCPAGKCLSSGGPGSRPRSSATRCSCSARCARMQQPSFPPVMSCQPGLQHFVLSGSASPAHRRNCLKPIGFAKFLAPEQALIMQAQCDNIISSSAGLLRGC